MATNEYGLDVDYFEIKLSSVLDEIDRYTPAEMVVELSRLQQVAAWQAEEATKKRLGLPEHVSVTEAVLRSRPVIHIYK